MNKNSIRIGLAVALCLLFFWITAAQLDPDLGWHLRVGQQILQDHTVPRFDTFSHTMAGHPWIDHEWLSDATLAFLEQHNLWLGAVIIFTMLAVLPFLVWLWRFEPSWQIFAPILLALLMANHIGVRAQMITFFCFFVLLEIFQKQSKWGFRLLPILFLLWVNLHGGFALGLGVLALYVSLSRRNVEGFTVFLLCVVATFINPYGPDIYGEVVSVVTSTNTSQYVAEWLSVLAHPALKTSLALSVLLFTALSVLLAYFVWLVWRYRKRLELSSLLISATLFFGYLKSLRFGPLFFVSALPIILQSQKFLQEEILASRTGRPFSNREQKEFNLIQIGVAVFLLAFATSIFWSPGRPHGYPVAAVEFLREVLTPGEIGNIFNDYAWGGYLVRHLPEVPVFIDGRMPHWISTDGYSAMQDYASIFYPENGISRYRKVVDEHDIQTIIIRTPKCVNRELSTRLKFLTNLQKISQISCQMKEDLVSSGWQVLFEDQTAIILHKI